MKRPWLAPFTPLYAFGARLREEALRRGWEEIRRLKWPVVSVGSLSAGGAGKTPFTIALARLLQREGIPVDVLSRGYGRRGAGAARVDPNGSAEWFGDEPMLIARDAGVPVFVAERRFEAGRFSEGLAGGGGQPKIDLHLLDDGFQHRQLARDVDIALIGSEDLADSLIPAGNLREELSALQRASVLAIPTGDDAAVDRVRKMGMQQPVWRFSREMRVPEAAKREAAGPVVAFCGIARPEQFFSGLESAGAQVAGRIAFADHHPFDARDIAVLQKLVAANGAMALVTTAKDQVRLGALETQLGVPVLTAGLRVALEDEAGAVSLLRSELKDRLDR
jgi:tetraacyldisaccharide 4'-kinase